MKAHKQVGYAYFAGNRREEETVFFSLSDFMFIVGKEGQKPERIFVKN